MWLCKYEKRKTLIRLAEFVALRKKCRLRWVHISLLEKDLTSFTKLFSKRILHGWFSDSFFFYRSRINHTGEIIKKLFFSFLQHTHLCLCTSRGIHLQYWLSSFIQENSAKWFFSFTAKINSWLRYITRCTRLFAIRTNRFDSFFSPNAT